MELIVILFAIIFIFLAILGRLLYGNYVNPITLFSGIWAIILLLYSFRLFDLYEASDLAIEVIIAGVLSFVAGGIVYTALFKDRHSYIPRGD